MLKILITDDHPVFIAGIKSLISTIPGVEVVGEATNGYEAVQLAAELSPHIIFMDIRMPMQNGIDASKQILANNDTIKIITVSSMDDEESVVQMMKAGAKGFLLKSCTVDQITQAIIKVIAGEEYYCKEVVEIIMRRFARGNPEIKEVTKSLSFSDRELAIIRMICQQKTSKDIGKLLFMSEKTIDFHRKKIIEKMGVKNMIGLAIFALKNRLVEMEEIA